MTPAQPHQCPVCQNHNQDAQDQTALPAPLVIERRLNIPTLQNVALADKDAAKTVRRGALTMVQCKGCGFVWNASFDPELISYDSDYNNDVTASGFYQAHLCEMADRILAAVPEDSDIHYVEIGCGEGDFLRLLHQRANGRVVSAVGFDPSCTTRDSLPDGVVIHTSYFTPDQLAKIPPETNVICSRHTIEHVNDVQGFAANLAAPMAPGRHLFVETPDVDWILRGGAFQDFFYEHCALYNPNAIKTLLAMHELSCDVASVYDGQYMWIHAQMDSDSTAQPSPHTPAVNNPLGQTYLTHRTRLMEDWSSYLLGRRNKGRVAIWGAASKGVTFSLLMNAGGHQMIDVGIDLNETKQGCFMPISGTPIVSPQTAMAQGVTTIIVMNPNYEAEIRAQIVKMGWQAEVTVLNETATTKSAALKTAS